MWHSNKLTKEKHNSPGENDGDGVELVWQLGFSRGKWKESQMKGGSLEARVTNLTAALAYIGFFIIYRGRAFILFYF